MLFLCALQSGSSGDSWLFQGWPTLGRLVVIAVPTYAALIFLLRISGKRTLSKMNAFDLVVTVTFGSTLATALLSPETTLVQAIAAFAFLVLAQFLITFFSVRSRRFQKLIKAEPALLYYQGRFVEDALRKERITHREVEAGARQAGYASITSVQAVVMETDGSLSVLGDVADEPESSFLRRLVPDDSPSASGG